MEIKILGTGCPMCKRLEQVARQAVAEAKVDAVVTKVTDVQAITAYPILSTPGLVVDEVVKSSGRIPQKDEVIAWIREAAG